MNEPRDTNAFLTVEEAAARLGTSRLRVREAAARGLITARHDNEGRLRVDLPDDLRLAAGNGDDLEPDAILGFLFDDIEDLEDALAKRDAEVNRLLDLVARQDGALRRADDVLANAEQDKTRLAGLLDRALSHLEAQTLHTDTRGDGQLHEAQTERLSGLLDRAMRLAEHNAGTKSVADRSFSLLENALAQLEQAQALRRRNDELLERSMQAGEAALRRSENARDKLAAQEKTLEATLALSERATALAEEKAQHPRKGFLRWLLGI